MKKIYYRDILNRFPLYFRPLFFLLLFLFLAGCARHSDNPSGKLPPDTVVSTSLSVADPNIESVTDPNIESVTETDIESVTETGIESVTETDIESVADSINETADEPVISEVDWSNYFDGLNGAAVIYEPFENHYQIYGLDLADVRRSPCSTFKIISSLTALEEGIIEPERSTRTWSGEMFWNQDWNHDINFEQAFHTSCVWYFREVIDEIGKERMQTSVNKLQYGNLDISDWEGRLNTNNSNPALTGFWIESSLKISPKEQAEVMERIFGERSEYSEETLKQLMRVMLLPEKSATEWKIYGKTGLGKAKGVVVDSWFSGFADKDADINDKRIYFCVYLGETADREVSSAKAKEIAIRIIRDLESQN